MTGRMVDETILGAIGKKHSYVRRIPEASTFDFDKTDLVNDLDAHDVDLSAVVPVEAVAITFRFILKDSVSDREIMIKDSFLSGVYQVCKAKLLVANINHELSGIISIHNAIITVQCINELPLDWQSIYFIVTGWFV